MMDESDFRPASPVPADEFLADDEKPFTEFGQYGEGRIDLRVFDQDVWWVDTHGTPHLLEEMEDGYLSNVEEFLLLNAEDFHMGCSLRYAIEQLSMVLPMGVKDGFGDYLKHRINPVSFPAEEWLRMTPLFMQIQTLLSDRETEQED